MVQALDNMKEWVMTLVLVVLIIAALAIALDGFQTGIESDSGCENVNDSFNSSSGVCYNATLAPAGYTSFGGPSFQYNVTQEGLSGTANAASYMDTIGTLIGVAALVAVVMVAFYFVRK